jgi:hypothetical protein
MISQQFPNITPERWADIKQVMRSEAHLDIQNDEGTDESHGIEFSWYYGENVLTITISVPHFGWALKLAGFHCEQDVMDSLAKKISSVS